MNYHNKYLKYKQKYIELKKQTGGDEDRIVKTIGNTGAREGMTLQCFWISILDYLNRHGYPYLTLKDLRYQAGLEEDTEHMSFDVDYSEGGYLIFFNAAEQIARVYNLRIQIYTAFRNGKITTPRGLIGNGINLIEIAQFGIGHFELIDATNGSKFIPAVLINGNLTKNIDPEIEYIALTLSDKQGSLQILKQLLKRHHSTYNDVIKEKENIMASTELKPNEKKESIEDQNQFINFIVNLINETAQKIDRLEEELSTLKVLISEFE